MTFREWWSYETSHDPKDEALARSAFEAGVEEGLRRAAEKEARKRPTGLIHNQDEPECPGVGMD